MENEADLSSAMADLGSYADAANQQTSYVGIGAAASRYRGERILPKGYARRSALQYVLSALESGVAIADLRAALNTIEAHLEQ